VIVAVMRIGIMRMPVPHRPMDMRVRVRLGAIPREIMLMLVMRVMHMSVLVRQGFMAVFMLVALGQVQPDAGGHQ
jgi:hypothetical protein